MRITADTSILVRALTGDDVQQGEAAHPALAEAEIVILAIPALCELVRVLSQGYRIAAPEVAAAIRRLIDSERVVVNRPAVEAGLALLDAGGDVADGAIAYEGRWLGASLSSPTLKSLHIVRRVTPSQKAIWSSWSCGLLQVRLLTN